MKNKSQQPQQEPIEEMTEKIFIKQNVKGNDTITDLLVESEAIANEITFNPFEFPNKTKKFRESKFGERVNSFIQRVIYFERKKVLEDLLSESESMETIDIRDVIREYKINNNL